jgi:hypothetical protein
MLGYFSFLMVPYIFSDFQITRTRNQCIGDIRLQECITGPEFLKFVISFEEWITKGAELIIYASRVM